MKIATLLLLFEVTCTGAFSQSLSRLNDITIKGTHNSYDCEEDCPLGSAVGVQMFHHPTFQVDDFGVWFIELDFSIIERNGSFHAYVGHDGTCGNGCWTHESWGPYLEDYFTRLANTRSFQYRPLILTSSTNAGETRHSMHLQTGCRS